MKTTKHHHQFNGHDPSSGVQNPGKNKENLWLKRSEDDVSYQRQAQLT